MADFNGYLICTDLDGTFTNNKSQLIEKNLTAADYYMKNGGLFTVSTGRSAQYLNKTYKGRLKINTHLICLNGTMIFDTKTNEVVYERHFDKECLQEIENHLGGLSEMIFYHTKEAAYNRFSDIPKSAQLHKIVISSKTPKDSSRLRAVLSEEYGKICSFVNSWSMGLELLPKGSGKGECVRFLRKILGSRVKTVIAAGDYENDITMIKEADIGYAVGNAIDIVKAASHRTTVSNEEGAIAEIIEDIKSEL